MAQETKTRFTLDMDTSFQRRLKVMAALKGVSMREYCLAAISNELEKDEEFRTKPRGLTLEAIERMRKVRDEVFKGKALKNDSTEIIRQAREERSKYLEERSQ
ncbi:MAG: hypothetical protein FJ320_03960 [SAR202 cluster bacterium]|nr:hypothetical protein [SAR202 cluster bacterium]